MYVKMLLYTVIINKLLSTKYPIIILHLTEWLLPTMLTHFLEDLFSFNKVDIKHNFFIVKLLKLIKLKNYNLTIMTEDVTNFAVQFWYSPCCPNLGQVHPTKLGN